MSERRGTITKSLGWKLAERFGVQGTQFVLQLVLANLLDPEHYGVLSLMMIFTTLANVFVQTGFNTALIQNKDVTEDDYSSVFWVSLLVALALYGVIFLCAPWIAAFYKMPEIVLPFRVLALMLLPGMYNSIQLAKVSREMDFKKVFLSNICGIVISGVVGVVIAYLGGGIWALVAQALLNVTIACLVMQFTVRWTPRRVCDMQRVRVLFSFGWKLLVSSLIDTLFQDLQSLIIGKKYDSGTLGYFNRGKQFPQFIVNSVNGAIQSVMLPSMSREQEERERVKALMRDSLTLSAYIIFPVMAGLAGVARPLIAILLPEKWLPCVPYIWVYCFIFAFYPVHTCNLQAINAMGRSDIFLKLEIIKKAYSLIAIIISVMCFDSPMAIALSGAVTVVLSLFVNAYPNKRLIGYAYWEQALDILPSLAVSLVMCAVVFALQLPGWGPWPTLAAELAAGVGVYVGLSALLRLRPYRLLLGLIRGYLGRGARE